MKMEENKALVYLPVYTQNEVESIYEENFIRISKILVNIRDYIEEKYNIVLIIDSPNTQITNLGVQKRTFLDTICLTMFDLSDTKKDLIVKGTPYNIIIVKIPILDINKNELFRLIFNFSLPEINVTPHYLFTNAINFSILDIEDFVEITTRDNEFIDVYLETFQNAIFEYCDKYVIEVINNSKQKG